MLSFPHSNTGVLSLLIADQKSATLLRRLVFSGTHRHRTPPLVGRSVYLDFKGMGRSVIQSLKLWSYGKTVHTVQLISVSVLVLILQLQF